MKTLGRDCIDAEFRNADNAPFCPPVTCSEGGRITIRQPCPFRYRVEGESEWHTDELKQGYECDGASIPFFARFFFGPTLTLFSGQRADINNAAYVHDKYYGDNDPAMTRRFADQIFYRLMQCEINRHYRGFDRRRRLVGAAIIYGTVRVFGRWSWK